MIPNVVKGSDMRGLVQYLVGPGKANAHTHPHVISGDNYLQAWHGAEELDRAAANQIADYLDHPRKTYGTEIRSKVWRQNPQTGAREPVLGVDGRQEWKDVHVWHCSLSLPTGDAPLAEDTWDAVASDFMVEMGFTAESGKSPARWVAIHHGPSGTNGNDHIHIAASMVREDGTRWDGRFRDYPKSQAVCRDLELKYGLTPVDGRQHGTAMPNPGKTVQGEPVTARTELAGRVRAAALASTTEAEWIRRLAQANVVIKPRFAAGTTDVVAGYRVALRTGGRERLHFYGGGQLGRDLSLPRIRENWPQPTIEQADAASAEWQAAFKGARTNVTDGMETRRWKPDVAAANLQAFTTRLAGTPISDRHAWNDAARDLSGALTAWAKFDPANAATLNAAAAVFARSAQQQRPGGQLGRRVKESPLGTARLFLAAKADDKPKIAGAVLMAQILAAAVALRDYHRATGNLRQAQAIDQAAIQRLNGLQLRGYQPDLSRMTPVERDAWIARAPGSPLPNPLTSREHTGSRTAPGRGTDARER